MNNMQNNTLDVMGNDCNSISELAKYHSLAQLHL